MRLRSVCKVLRCDKCATTPFVKFATHLRWKRVRKSPQEGVLHGAARFLVVRGRFLVGGNHFCVFRTANASVAIVFAFIAKQMRRSQPKSDRSQRVCVVRSADQSFATQISLLQGRSVFCISKSEAFPCPHSFIQTLYQRGEEG